MLIVACVTALLCLTLVLLPFFVGQGGMLASGSAFNSLEQLEAIKAAIVRRFVQEEAAYQRKEISPRAWQTRKAFLVHRYMDAARRADYMRASGQGEKNV